MTAETRTILVLGATGTIGRATTAALVLGGHRVICPVRRIAPDLPDSAEQPQCDVTDRTALAALIAQTGRVDAIVSCLASRSGAPQDAWAIDHDAHVSALELAEDAGVSTFVLLSAICVQRPELAFQKAKLAFENRLMASRLTWSIVRPTAYFKSLSGQIARVRDGKPFLVFGDGRLTACKPISDRDLGRYMADCVSRVDRRNRVLPIGGPGPAITPLDQAEMLFDLLGAPQRLRHVPVAMMNAIIGGLRVGGALSPRLRAKADLARIGRYYATQSMLVWDAQAARYDAEATPSFGTDTLRDHYAAVLRGEAEVDLGEHAVF
ncbi:NAD(P)H-binding protein [Anianabacter salinae]|uniref:NAD(P)H-binding protein n=1 Tax=Anianabacter salinae TaxID=2851023 RepID=UPI00225E32CF|nr:NAD(P)H-binding protein [Anianabacter salinae]MBV0910969.1 NAD(P)H-binding protein [Anianabacter salinae]